MKPIEQKDPPEEVSGGTQSDLDRVEILCPTVPIPSPYPKEPITPHFE